jgi:hypothetical protein
MASLDINIVRPVINKTTPIFDALITLMSEHLASCGNRVTVSVNEPRLEKMNIFVGHAMFLQPDGYALVRSKIKSYVVFQLEVLDERYGFASKFPAYFDFLRGAEQVWEYSTQNIPHLDRLGIRNVRYIPIGYSEKLETVPPQGQGNRI